MYTRKTAIASVRKVQCLESLRERKHISNFGCRRHLHK